MKQYQELLRHILDHGSLRDDRTGVGTLSIFGYQMRFDLSKGFPLVTTKKVHLKSIIYELLWFLKGDTNIDYLNKHDVNIWNQWADDQGNLGPIYGSQWRNWNGEQIDQIQHLIDDLKTNPKSRRLIVSAWNPSVLPDTSKSFSENVANHKAALPPCHTFFQFYVSQGRLSCQLYQRSADVFLGVPFNIASYALLTMMVSQVCDLKLGEFIHSFGDVHIYKNHLEQVKEQLSREPLPLPTVRLNPSINNIFDFDYKDFKLENYQSHPVIKAPIAV